MQDQV